MTKSPCGRFYWLFIFVILTLLISRQCSVRKIIHIGFIKFISVLDLSDSAVCFGDALRLSLVSEAEGSSLSLIIEWVHEKFVITVFATSFGVSRLISLFK